MLEHKQDSKVTTIQHSDFFYITTLAYIRKIALSALNEAVPDDADSTLKEIANHINHVLYLPIPDDNEFLTLHAIDFQIRVINKVYYLINEKAMEYFLMHILFIDIEECIHQLKERRSRCICQISENIRNQLNPATLESYQRAMQYLSDEYIAQEKNAIVDFYELFLFDPGNCLPPEYRNLMQLIDNSLNAIKTDPVLLSSDNSLKNIRIHRLLMRHDMDFLEILRSDIAFIVATIRLLFPSEESNGINALHLKTYPTLLLKTQLNNLLLQYHGDRQHASFRQCIGTFLVLIDYPGRNNILVTKGNRFLGSRNRNDAEIKEKLCEHLYRIKNFLGEKLGQLQKKLDEYENENSAQRAKISGLHLL